MKDEKKKGRIWKSFFMIMGIIFSVILVIISALVLYFLIVRPSVSDVISLPGGGTLSDIDIQEAASQITPEQEACATEKLGEERVAEIKAGSDITTSDFLKAGRCFQ
jgi:LPS O-antigen subunit length determinant protein (WzzB/FepE family)